MAKKTKDEDLYENEPTEKSFEWAKNQEKSGEIEKMTDELLEELGISEDFNQ